MIGRVNCGGGNSNPPYLVHIVGNASLIDASVVMTQFGQKTVSGTIPSSSPYTCTLKPYHSGVWTITVTKGSDVRTKTIKLMAWDEYTTSAGNKYTFKVAKATSDPYSRVIYTDDIVSYTPAHMDYTGGVFDYGSWEDAFFMPKPCMLKNNGTVDYYLDPNDYSKKLDGTTSDIANASYAGNVMVEFPHAWIHQSEDEDYEYYGIADYKVDNSYNDYPWHNMNGESVDYFYHSAYKCSYVSSALRSISNLTPGNGLSGTTEIGYVSSAMKDLGFYTTLWSHRNYISCLLKLIGKSTDVQAVFGRGHDTGGTSASSLHKTGLLNDKGLFWGTNANGTNGVKVFGIEHFWGDRWDRIAGLTTLNQNIYAKMTYGTEDGTTGTGWVTNTSGYKNMGVSMNGTTASNISKSKNTDFGCFPVTMSGSNFNVYDCDRCDFATNITGYALVGGHSNVGFGAGLAMSVSHNVSETAWYMGASLSCIPNR